MAEKIRLPEPGPITVSPERTALLVLDMSERCADPKQPCHKLGQRMAGFLERARESGLLIVFTVSTHLRGTPGGKVYSLFKRKPSEAEIFPDAFNKFTGGELQNLLGSYNVDTLIVTGFRSNVAVLYTATAAAREFKYHVIIPIDGIATLTDYEQEYTLYQFTSFRKEISNRFAFTSLDMIQFVAVG